MTSVLAPRSMNRREAVRGALAEVPTEVAHLRMEFEGEQFATVSFMDELVRQVLHEDRAHVLELVHPHEFTAELASVAAERYGVSERLIITREGQPPE